MSNRSSALKLFKESLTARNSMAIISSGVAGVTAAYSAGVIGFPMAAVSIIGVITSAIVKVFWSKYDLIRTQR
jgi:heterodisulfide reductase subunit A-like polyferredoxin